MRRLCWLWLVAAAIAVAALQGRCEANLIKVGGRYGWSPDVNYTEWASSQHFYVGDWLYFIFDKHYYSVFEVNETNYERCSEKEFITNITRGGRDVFNLTHPGPYYFLSSGGYCWHGMKLTINATTVPTPAPSPSKSTAPPVTTFPIPSFSPFSSSPPSSSTSSSILRFQLIRTIICPESDCLFSMLSANGTVL